MVWVEAELVVSRLNQQEASRAVLLQMAVSSVISKKGQARFNKAMKELTGNG